MVKTELNAKAKATPAKVKTSVKKHAVKKTAVHSTPTSINGSRPAANKKKLSHDLKNVSAQPKRQLPPIPEGWPVTSKSPYRSPTIVSQRDKGDQETNDQDLQNVSQKDLNYLRPGHLLRVNCNGSDVFLRKRAIQSTSLSFPSSDVHDNKVNKGGPTRFLVVFPGRLSLKPPKVVSKTSLPGEDCDNVVEETKEDEEEGEDPGSLNNEKGDDDDDDNNHVPVKKTRSPFAPTNPPHLLGKLVCLGGADSSMELRIPFPSSHQNIKTSALDSTPSNENPGKQLIFSGRAIPLEGKFMALTFKRTGGSGAGKDSSKSAKNKKIGTGSIACKDIFRSVIVLGESNLPKGEDRMRSGSLLNDRIEDDADETEGVVLRHYGGSERTVDGGGHGGLGASQKSISARKDSLGTAKSFISAKGIDDDESDLGSDDSDGGDDAVNDEEEKNVSDLDSDDEFVPSSSNKKRKVGQGEKEDEPVVPVPKRTSRRSASKSVNVSYVDEDSDVDLDNDGSESENESDNESQSDVDEFDELLDGMSKKGRVGPKPKALTSIRQSSKGKTSKTIVSRASSKRGRKSSPHSAVSSKKISYVEIDSGNDDKHDGEVVVLDSDTSVEGLANTKSKMTTKPVSKNDSSTKVTKSQKNTLSSPVKSPISPRRRKRASPHKSPSSNGNNHVLDLSDDSFSFL
ncbi:hypothetical protein ACHAW6_007140 [Cyclotella cf. meneghiniana]